MSNDPRPTERTGTTPRRVLTRAEANELTALIDAARQAAKDLTRTRRREFAGLATADDERVALQVSVAAEMAVDEWVTARIDFSTPRPDGPRAGAEVTVLAEVES